MEKQALIRTCQREKSGSRDEVGGEELKKHHFVLVHGACQGGWCWYKLATLLRSGGHRVTAPDLAAAGINTKRPEEIRSISDYFQPLMEVMASLPPDDKVILVGHSMGGVGTSAAMERFPDKISAAVFASALRLGPNFTIPTLQQEDLTLAKMLMKPTRLYGGPELLQEVPMSTEKYGSVNRVFIVCQEDKARDEAYQRWMIHNNPVTEVKVIPGSDHMVMLSKPMELCTCLLNIAERYS